MNWLKKILTAGPRPIWLRYLLLIAAASGLTRFALGTQWMRESAVLYVLIPYLIGVLIYLFVPASSEPRRWTRFWRHMRTALIVMLSTSLLLFEGFLCVLMFLPIYTLFAGIVIATNPLYAKPPNDSILRDENGDKPSRKLRSSLVPLAIILLSLDGIGGVGPDRMTEVRRTAVLDLTPAQIRENIIDHSYPASGRSRLLALFPRPTYVEAKSLAIGDRHTAHMEYRRWGVDGLNVHRGTMVMEFTESTETQLRARFIHDDSYLSHYMDFQSWALDMVPVGNGQTQVTLSVGYERKLAPAWYFGPLQRKAVGDGLSYALSDILAPAK